MVAWKNRPVGAPDANSLLMLLCVVKYWYFDVGCSFVKRWGIGSHSNIFDRVTAIQTRGT
jgi:hypothetical protein